VTAITTDDLLFALQAAVGDGSGPEGSTGPELQERSGMSRDLVHRSLKALIKAGKVEVVRVRRPRLDGVMSSVPGYRMIH
jgi:DNA-binding IclR family transcriptional regulator